MSVFIATALAVLTGMFLAGSLLTFAAIVVNTSSAVPVGSPCDHLSARIATSTAITTALCGAALLGLVVVGLVTGVIA